MASATAGKEIEVVYLFFGLKVNPSHPFGRCQRRHIKRRKEPIDQYRQTTAAVRKTEFVIRIHGNCLDLVVTNCESHWTTCCSMSS
mgnify:CR=1 FL=1